MTPDATRLAAAIRAWATAEYGENAEYVDVHDVELAEWLTEQGWTPPADRPLTSEEIAEFPPTNDPDAMAALGYVRVPDGPVFTGCWVKAEGDE